MTFNLSECLFIKHNKMTWYLKCLTLTLAFNFQNFVLWYVDFWLLLFDDYIKQYSEKETLTNREKAC